MVLRGLVFYVLGDISKYSLYSSTILWESMLRSLQYFEANMLSLKIVLAILQGLGVWGFFVFFFSFSVLSKNNCNFFFPPLESWRQNINHISRQSLKVLS